LKFAPTLWDETKKNKADEDANHSTGNDRKSID